MINATGNPQRIVLFGGTSDLGLAIVREYLRDQPAHVVLATRAGSPHRRDAEDQVQAWGALSVKTLDFDSVDTAAHPALVAAVFADGDVDIAILAAGQLGDAATLWRDQPRLVGFLEANFTGLASIGALLADRLPAQGHGQIIVLSSVAGEMVRRSNFVYGAAKAGLDGFFRQLGVALDRTGVKVLVVRPGMVATKMTAGLKPAPLTTTPEAAAAQIVAAQRAGKTLIWVPPLFRAVMLILKHIPAPLLRLLPV
jgi:decaprenylphospho-beta-D-erythro-pentofuranosid-2-ulose 2-reductase